jgi:hypothetical protein
MAGRFAVQAGAFSSHGAMASRYMIASSALPVRAAARAATAFTAPRLQARAGSVVVVKGTKIVSNWSQPSSRTEAMFSWAWMTGTTVIGSRDPQEARRLVVPAAGLGVVGGGEGGFDSPLGAGERGTPVILGGDLSGLGR